MLNTARAILAMDTSPFGPSLSLLPVMRALRTSYPKTLLVAAAPVGTCELLTACGLVDETISLGVVKLSENGRSGGLKKLLELAKGARLYGFDVVLDFSPSVETLVVSRLVLRARVFTPSKLPRVMSMLLDFGRAPRIEASSDYANVLKQIGVEMKDARFNVAPPVEEDARFEHRLASSGSRGGELIVLLYASNPGSPGSWTIDGFGEIATRLANNFSARIVAVDEPADQSFTRAMGALIPRGSIKLAEPRALELIAAIARASVVITDEAAIARLASELGTPVIEIADSISNSAPASTSHRIVRGSSRSKVLPDEVYEAASEMIQENRSRSLFDR